MGLIVDNFAGGGGASVGIEQAMGRPVDIAINHDPEAIAMHMVNHPKTRHYTEDVWDIDPVKVCEGEPVDLAWFSPDCKHFSKAKGGKPRDKNIRGLAWVAIRWAVMVRPKVIILENVEEFKTWGPLDNDGNIIDGRKGETFQSFVAQLKALGYAVDYRELIACDYGAPTKRKRFFLIARCGGGPIRWPEPTHGPGLKPYETAASIIDWNIPRPSIFATSEEIKEQYGIRAVRPLAKNTINRIARGIDKFVDGEPRKRASFLIQYHSETRSGEVRGQKLDEPIMTLDSSNRYRLVTAFLVKYYGQGIGQSINSPLHTVTSRERFGLVVLNSEPHAIIDIGMRMLTPRELFNAQGFPPDYVIDRDINGKKLSKSAQVARCGNAVPPAFSRALAMANCSDKVVGAAV